MGYWTGGGGELPLSTPVILRTLAGIIWFYYDMHHWRASQHPAETFQGEAAAQ